MLSYRVQYVYLFDQTLLRKYFATTNKITTNHDWLSAACNNKTQLAICRVQQTADG